MLMALCLSLGVYAVDWSTIGWVEASGDKYKVEAVEGLSVVNVQQPGWAAEKGIYVHVPAGITSCSVNGAIDGAGVVLYLSSFTAKETPVKIVHGTGEVNFLVYYADGTGEVGGNEGGNEGEDDKTDQPEDIWSAFLGDGAGGGKYNNLYKVEKVSGLNPINIQNAPKSGQAGIYIAFPAAPITDCTVAHETEGAGVWLFLTAFVNQETTVSLRANEVTYTFRVWYEKGQVFNDTTAINMIQTDKQSQVYKTIENGQVIIVKDNVKYTIKGTRL